MKFLVIFLVMGIVTFVTSNNAFGWCDQNDVQSDVSCYAPYQDFPESKQAGLVGETYTEIDYSQFLMDCEGHLRSFTESMTPLERQLSLLCDRVDIGFTEKQWIWLNGTELDWEVFARSASEDYANKIPEFVDGGIKETLRIDSFVSGRDLFPPPMIAMISFDYEKLSQVIHYDEKFEICGNGNLIPYEGFINCSDKYVTYDSTKEETFSVPKFAKNIPLPEHARQQMLDWCKNSPKWAKIDKQFWDVVPTRILSTIPEFESLKGKTGSIVVHSYTSEDTCPPDVWMAGTFISENGDAHKFSLYHNSDFFRYNIDEIQCNDDGHVLTKRPNGKIACVYPTTAEKLDWQIIDADSTMTPSIFEVQKDGRVFDVVYEIRGGVVTNMVFDKKILFVTIDPINKGSLILNIPRDLSDAKLDYCPPKKANAPDDMFFVLLDGLEIPYDEIQTTPEKRTLQIQFGNNATKIEVIGTCLI